MSNLDDFFKKRDKKKKTTKSKFPTLDTDEFAKKLEATSGGAELDEADYQDNNNNIENVVITNPTSTVNYSSNVASSGSGDHLDEEWKPFDSDENKDYSGLRVIINKWKVEDEYAENDGEGVDYEKKPSFTWGSAPAQPAKKDEDADTNETKQTKETANQKPAEEASTAKTPTEPAKETSTAPTASTTTAAPSTGAYIPPSLRRQMESSDKPAAPAPAADTTSASSGKYIPPSLRNKNPESTNSTSSSAIPPTSVNYRRNKAQPNIMDTSEFPTLDAALTDVSQNEKVVNGNSEK